VPEVWRQFRPIFGFQAVATAAMAILAAWISGGHGAVSAVLGGLVSIIAGLGFALMVAKNKTRTAGEVLRDAFRAEAVKIALGFGLLWLVFRVYQDVVAVALIGAFCITILIFSMAIFVGDPKTPK
jgi:ATP synthase protein I